MRRITRGFQHGAPANAIGRSVWPQFRSEPAVLRARKMRTNVAAIRVGRLLEIRAEAGYRTAAEVDAVFDTIDREVRKVRTPRYVTVVDWRGCPVMSPEAVERIAQRIALTNTRTE